MMRIIVAVVSWCLATACAGAAPGAYDDLVARAKAGEGAVDFTALRDAYALSPIYEPYGESSDGAKQAMREAFNARDCTKVLNASDSVLAAVFIDIEAHLLRARCFELGGDGARALFHRGVAKGLMDSIVASGNGRSTKTAFVVVTVREEYDVLAALRWRMVSQALIDDDGHAFDRMEVQSTTSEATATLFFQIDRPMAWLSRRLDR
ncbi:MAG: DUF4919 domain-containing protein [Alphaproteobacteria bacterium]|nr:DUF4919 domain-containing protein [Alphaproteobacteria bacterium]